MREGLVAGVGGVKGRVLVGSRIGHFGEKLAQNGQFWWRMEEERANKDGKAMKESWKSAQRNGRVNRMEIAV